MTLQEKFARLGTDNAPGQEGLQKEEALPMIGDKLEGPAVDFSHGDVNAHTPIPGSLETFVKQYAVEGTYQAYTEYRGKGTIRQYLAEKLAEYSGAPVDPDTEIILTPGTQGALFLAMGSLVARGDKVAIVEPDYFDNRKLVEFFEGEIVPIQMRWQEVERNSGIDLEQLERPSRAGSSCSSTPTPTTPPAWSTPLRRWPPSAAWPSSTTWRFWQMSCTAGRSLTRSSPIPICAPWRRSLTS